MTAWVGRAVWDLRTGKRLELRVAEGRAKDEKQRGKPDSVAELWVPGG